MTPITPALSLFITDPTYQPLLPAVRNDQSDDKSASTNLWIKLLPLIFPPKENYKIHVHEEAGLLCKVIEVSDCSPHPKTRAKSEELLLAIHIWKRGAKDEECNELVWRQKQIAEYWRTRGATVKQPDSVSVDEEQWTIGSGLRHRDKITRAETSGVYWVNTKTIDVRRDGSRNGTFSLQQQLEEVDRFLDIAKRKKRAWGFENVDWAYNSVERRKISLMKRRAAVVNAKWARV